MNVAKYRTTSGQVFVGIVEGDQVRSLALPPSIAKLQDLLATDRPGDTIASLPTGDPLPLSDVKLLPPIDAQEVWAAGVTYRRSQTARMEESEAAASCYDRVYQADRPELFFKATPSRVVGHGQAIRIRADSTWNVPEPEVTLVLSPTLKIVGLTVGNDMSSRSIEGENPLYLPQAKTYDQCAGLGPWIRLYDQLPPGDQIAIELKIVREDEIVFNQSTSADQMARGFDELVGWLGRDMTFPNGAFLMTGTGIVPTSDFTLRHGDRVSISISGVGTLTNTVTRRDEPQRR